MVATTFLEWVIWRISNEPTLTGVIDDNSFEISAGDTTDSSYYTRVRVPIFHLICNCIGVAIFLFILYRLYAGYKKAVTGQYKEYNNNAININPNNNNNTNSNSFFNLPLIFPVYTRYFQIIFIFTLLEYIASVFVSNTGNNNIYLFLINIALNVSIICIEQGLIALLIQRNIGRKAFISVWFIIIVLFLICSIGNITAGIVDKDEILAAFKHFDNIHSHNINPDKIYLIAIAYIFPLNLHSSSTYEESYLIRDYISNNHRYNPYLYKNTIYTVLTINLCLVLIYILLLLLRSNKRLFNYLQYRKSSVILLYYYIIRRVINILQLLFYLYYSINAAAGVSLINDIFLISYPIILYSILVLDTQFWRNLEYLTQGPYKDANNDNNNHDNSPNNGRLLQLPRAGLINYSGVSPFLIDFSLLDIHTHIKLGIGGYNNRTTVYRANYCGLLVAVKRIHCDLLTVELIETILHEAAILCKLGHPNIIKLIGVCVKPPSIIIVSELGEKGTLQQFIARRRKFIEKQKNKHYIHNNHIARISNDNNRNSYNYNSNNNNLNEPLLSSAHHSRNISECDAVMVRSHSNYNANSNDIVISLPDFKYNSWDGVMPSISICSSIDYQYCRRLLPYTRLFELYNDSISSLYYLHSQRPHPIVHADVKLSNFVLDAHYKLKLIDFGTSHRLDDSYYYNKKNTNQVEAITLAYLAPEKIKQLFVPNLPLQTVKNSQNNETYAGTLVPYNHEQGLNPRFKLNSNDLHQLLNDLRVDGLEYYILNDNSIMNSNDEWKHILEISQSKSNSFANNNSFNDNVNMAIDEAIENDDASNLAAAVDIYSYGLILNCLLTLRTSPYTGIPSLLLPYLIVNRVRPAIPLDTPPLLKKLIESCLANNHALRPNAKQLIQRLQLIQSNINPIKKADSTSNLVSKNSPNHSKNYDQNNNQSATNRSNPQINSNNAMLPNNNNNTNNINAMPRSQSPLPQQFKGDQAITGNNINTPNKSAVITINSSNILMHPPTTPPFTSSSRVPEIVIQSPIKHQTVQSNNGLTGNINNSTTIATHNHTSNNNINSVTTSGVDSNANASIFQTPARANNDNNSGASLMTPTPYKLAAPSLKHILLTPPTENNNVTNTNNSNILPQHNSIASESTNTSTNSDLNRSGTSNTDTNNINILNTPITITAHDNVTTTPAINPVDNTNTSIFNNVNTVNENEVTSSNNVNSVNANNSFVYQTPAKHNNTTNPNTPLATPTPYKLAAPSLNHHLLTPPTEGGNESGSASKNG